MKYVDSLETFKSKIRMWKPNKCSCRICKYYIPKTPFLQDIYSGFGLVVKNPSNFAVASLLKNFIVFIS